MGKIFIYLFFSFSHALKQTHFPPSFSIANNNDPFLSSKPSDIFQICRRKNSLSSKELFLSFPNSASVFGPGSTLRSSPPPSLFPSKTEANSANIYVHASHTRYDAPGGILAQYFCSREWALSARVNRGDEDERERKKSCVYELLRSSLNEDIEYLYFFFFNT